MANHRLTRYEVFVVRQDGKCEMVQCNSRRDDAIRRARLIAAYRDGWPTVTRTYVVDTRSFGDARFPASFNRVP